MDISAHINEMFAKAAIKNVSVAIDSTKAEKLGDGKKYLHVNVTAFAMVALGDHCVKRAVSTQQLYPLTRDNLSEYNLTTRQAMADTLGLFFGTTTGVSAGNEESPAKAARVKPSPDPMQVVPESTDDDDEGDETPVKGSEDPAPKRGRGRPKKDATPPKLEVKAGKKGKAAKDDDDDQETPKPKTRKNGKKAPEIVKYQVGDKVCSNALAEAAAHIWGDDWKKNKELFAEVKEARAALVGTPILADGEVTQEFIDALKEEVGIDPDDEEV